LDDRHRRQLAGPERHVLGAMQLAADYALGLILGEALPPALVLPPRGRLK